MDEERRTLDRIAIIQDLEDLLGHKVDMVNERAYHLHLRDRIVSEAMPL